MLFIFLGFAASFCVQLTSSAASFICGLSLLTSGCGDIFFRTSYVCYPHLLDEVRMSVTPSPEQAVSTSAGLEISVTCEDRNSMG
jgi:hypothetical protein